MTGSAFGGEPLVVKHPKGVTVRQGDDVTLECVVEYLPADNLEPVQWTRGGFGLGHARNLPCKYITNIFLDVLLSKFLVYTLILYCNVCLDSA